MHPYTPRKLAIAVVAMLAPLIMAFSVFIANEAQILFHLELDGTALAGYISVFLVAVVVALVRVLRHLVHVDLLGFMHRAELLLAGAAAGLGQPSTPPPATPPSTPPPATPAPPVPGVPLDPFTAP